MLKDSFEQKRGSSKAINGLEEDGKKSIYNAEVPQGMWRKCNKCGAAIYTEDVIHGQYICPKCHGYFRMHAYRRIEQVIDQGTFEDWNLGLEQSNPLGFHGYEKKFSEVQVRTNLDEAVITGKGQINGLDTVICVMDARFFMGSMGKTVGEKITRAVERAIELKLPVVIFTCSGGARMQEGIISLMQMAKTSAALKKHSDAGLLSVTVLTDPTTGGVTASFAMLGDIILAEKGALIGFAGPRVIEQTIRQKLPPDFQRSEFLQDHGFIDAIVERQEMKITLTHILGYHSKRDKENVPRASLLSKTDLLSEVSTASHMSAWDKVLLSRKADRPTGLDYVDKIFDHFFELHGDRYYKDDGAIVGGLAYFRGEPVTVIVQQKGRNTKDNILRNFGMPSPDGYRKALRLMKQAEKFHRPIICLVDTPGAFCGIEAEERGQGEAIARNLFEMSAIKTPIVSIVIGEGGSGGALAMAVADEVWMLENAVYSILSPEGFASILWKDSKRASEAAGVMKITADDLKRMGVIEHVIIEKSPASLENIDEISKRISARLEQFLMEYEPMNVDDLVTRRYERFRKF